MATVQTTISPVDQSPVVEKTYPTKEELDQIIAKSVEAQKSWKSVPLDEKIGMVQKFLAEFQKNPDGFSKELTAQMGRPLGQSLGEMKGMLARAEYLLSIAKEALSDVPLTSTDAPGFRRFIKRVPLGVVFVIAPWNYPYLTVINSLLPAVLAGNTVILKPSPQTPLTAELLKSAWDRASLPPDVFQVVHLPPELVSHAVASTSINFVAFTGSVVGGAEVEKAAVNAPGFKGVALELGGKDPAYVRPDADIDYTAAQLVDGAFFNSGQSCCAIERIYVHEQVYDKFVEKAVEITKEYKLGNPFHEGTNLGPVISLKSAEKIRKQVSDAIAAGAKALVPEDLFPIAKEGTTYVAPQILVDVNHSMDVMMEETFGPIVGIMKVSSDTEAIRLMNDSPYGLTASIWTDAKTNRDSEESFLEIADALETGTVFLNRCDYLDPALCWTGVKDSGRGVSLSKFGFDQLTRPKSVHMKISTS